MYTCFCLLQIQIDAIHIFEGKIREHLIKINLQFRESLQATNLFKQLSFYL